MEGIRNLYFHAIIRLTIKRLVKPSYCVFRGVHTVNSVLGSLLVNFGLGVVTLLFQLVTNGILGGGKSAKFAVSNCMAPF